jgi:hypothetical protein
VSLLNLSKSFPTVFLKSFTPEIIPSNDAFLREFNTSYKEYYQNLDKNSESSNEENSETDSITISNDYDKDNSLDIIKNEGSESDYQRASK